MANVAFLDGHVETKSEVPVPTPAWAAQAQIDAMRAQYQLGFIGDTDIAYEGQ